MTRCMENYIFSCDSIIFCVALLCVNTSIMIMKKVREISYCFYNNCLYCSSMLVWLSLFNSLNIEMKGVVFVEQKKDEFADPSEIQHLERREVNKLEEQVEEIPAVVRANFDVNTMKVYAEIDEESDDLPTKADFIQAIQQWWNFRAINVKIG